MGCGISERKGGVIYPGAELLKLGYNVVGV